VRACVRACVVFALTGQLVAVSYVVAPRLYVVVGTAAAAAADSTVVISVRHLRVNVMLRCQ